MSRRWVVCALVCWSASFGVLEAASNPRSGRYDPIARNYAYYSQQYAYSVYASTGSTNAYCAYLNAWYAYYYLDYAWETAFDQYLDGSVQGATYAYYLNLAHYFSNQAYYYSYVADTETSLASASQSFQLAYYTMYYASTASYQGAPNDGLTAELRTLRDRHNYVRLSLGLSRLQVDYRLINAADGHAQWMASTNTMSHTGANNSSSFQRAVNQGYSGYSTTVAENIGYGYPSESGVFQAWTNSSGHYQNIVYPSLKHIGLSVRTSPSTGARYWAVEFGSITE